MLEIAEKFEYLDNNKECIYNSVNNFGIAFKDINITRQNWVLYINTFLKLVNAH